MWFDLHKTAAIEGHITQHNYPYDKALQLRGKQFYSSISYMIAYAILNKYTHIYLYGVDLEDRNEIRTNQRECCLRWLEFARSVGVKTILPKASPLNSAKPDYSKDLPDFMYWEPKR